MAAAAFMGCAHIHTPEFARMALRHRHTEVTSVWDHDRERAERLARELGAAVAAERDEIWRDATIEAVFVCSETIRHRELVEEALAAAKHLFVEKPLAADAQEAHALAAGIERADVLFQTGYFMRGQGAHRQLRAEIADGRLGRIARIRVTNGNPAALEGWFDDRRWRWMADPALAGFGGFGDEGAHAADLGLWLLGHPRVESVAAAIGPVVGRYGGVDEVGEALVRLEGGAILTIAAGWVEQATSTTVEISGTRGRARVEGGTRRDGGAGAPPDDPHPFELFLDSLAGDAGAPLVPAREAAAATALLDAAYRAAREGAWVRL